MVSNKTLVYKHVPNGMPVVGKDLVVEDRPFDLDAPPPPGGVVVQVLYSSLDPYLRGRMRDPSVPSYAPAMALNSPVVNDAVARVLAADAGAAVKVGDLVHVFVPIAQYACVPGDSSPVRGQAAVRRIENPLGLDLALFLGPLGMPGLTAYAGLHAIGQPKMGETLFVSSAAGAVGQLVGQLAKREGLRVIGSVGSAAKLAFIQDELGYEGFNYHDESPLTALPRLAPGGIDIYFENVGGDHLEAAVENMNVGGRIAVCGMISDYNKKPGEARTALQNMLRLVMKRIRIQGFLVSDPAFGPAYAAEHQARVQEWLHDGSLQAKLSITEGIEHAAEAFVGMLQGDNFGKTVVKIAD